MNRYINSMKFADVDDSDLEYEMINKGRRRGWYPPTWRISRFIRKNKWGKTMSVEPIYGRRYKLLEISVTIIPRGAWRLKKENYESIKNNLYIQSGGVLHVVTDAQAFGRGVMKIAVIPVVRGYDQWKVITALRQMKNNLNTHFRVD